MTNRVFFRFLASAMMLSCVAAGFSLRAEEKSVHVIEFPEIEFPEIRWEIPETITLTMTDEAGRPRAGVGASFSIVLEQPEWSGIAISEGRTFQISEGKSFQIPDLVTDAEGKIVIEIPPEARDVSPYSVAVSVPTQGLLMQTGVHWDMGNADDSDLITVPGETKITVREGKMFRLIVVDEDGKPVEGVQVGGSVDFDFAYESLRGILRAPPKQYTDENGVYTWGPVPKDYTERLSLGSRRVYHPDFVRWPIGQRMPGTPQQLSSRITDEYTLTLERGRVLAGVVLDADGRPVAGADVFAGGQDAYAEKGTQTDENGRFEVKGLLDRPLVLVVRKPGMIRWVEKIQPKNFDEALSIALQPAKTLRVRLVTDQGELYRSQFGLEPPPIDLGEYQYTYNVAYAGFQQADGLWEWNEAPDEERDYRLQLVGLSAPAPGERQIVFEHDKIYKLRPREEPYQIVLKTEEVKPESITAGSSRILPEKMEIRVLDEDGTPKPDATVTVECYSGSGDSWGILFIPRKVVQSFTTDDEGIVRIDFSKVRQSTTIFDLRVSAEGCQTTRRSWESSSRLFYRESEVAVDERLDVLLASREKTTGFVHDEEGNPVEGAEVTLHDIRNSVYRGEKQIDLKRTEPVLTDTNGKWECPLVLDGYLFANQRDFSKGYVEIKKDGYLDSKTHVSAGERLVTLKRARKITGRIVDENDNPLKGALVVLGSSKSPFSSLQYQTYTDGDGRFEMAAPLLDESEGTEIFACLRGRQADWKPLDLSQDANDVELVLKPGTTMRLRFDIDEGVPFPNLVFSVGYSGRWLQGRMSFQNLKPDENGVIVLEGVSAPMPDADVIVTIQVGDGSRTYRPELNSYVFKHGDEELRVRIVENPLPAERQRLSAYIFSSNSRIGSIRYTGNAPQ